MRTARITMAAVLATGLVLAIAVAARATGASDPTVDGIRKELLRLPYYGVFDYMSFGIDRGTVTLTGYTYNGSLRSAAENAAKRSSGVDEVANRLEVLPTSQEDDRIRWVTFYKIYTDAFLSRYASGGEAGVRREIYEARRFPGMYQPLGFYSIHIVVRHGQTTLYGVVDSAGDRHIAEVRAREVFGVFSVENEIVVAKKAAKR